MPRLLSRTRFPPGQFQVLIVEAGMKAPVSGSFRECVEFTLGFRRANPHIAKRHDWTLSLSEIEKWVDIHNAERLAAEGYLSFISPDNGLPASAPQKKSPLVRAAAAFAGATERTISGAALIVAWLGEGGEPVARALAESRARTCLAPCPLNDSGGLERFLTKPIAATVRAALSLKNDLAMATPHDADLGICKACLCPLPLKVWTPLAEIRRRMSADTRKRLDPGCWVLAEEREP
jgi:hypothetical protein